MSFMSFRILMAALAVRTVASVSLSNFVPAINSLPSACSVVYNKALSGCVAADFDASKQRCSANCVNGLINISQEINKACSLDDVSETSIIGVFLLGQGIPILCKGVSVTTIGKSSTSTTVTSTSSTTSTKAAVTSTQEVQSQSTDASSSSAPTSTATTSTATNTETSSTAAPTSTSAGSQPSFVWSLPPTPSQTTSSQKSNSDSGGGSPFDVIATGSSTRRRSSVGLTGAILGLAVLACALI